MGKTVPSYRVALEFEIERWKGFSKALTSEGDREAFEELMDMRRNNALASGATYGFIIHTSDATIAYTGDFRLHGTRKDLSEDFIEKAKESSPDALIYEGTRMALTEKRQNYSKQQVEEKRNQIVASTDKIVFTTHYSRDIDKFRSFYNG